MIAMPPSGVPVAADAHGAATGPLLGQHDREKAGGEDAEEAEEDQIVGGVGERPRVAAVVDVQRDVPVHAECGDDQGTGGEQRRQCRPRGQTHVARGVIGDAAQLVGAPVAVGPAEIEQCESGDNGAARGEQNLADRCPSGRGGVGCLGHWCHGAM